MLKIYRLLLFLLVFLFSFSLAQPAISQIGTGIVTFHEADDTIPYDWFSYVPNSAIKAQMNYIWVTAEGGSWDYDDNTNAVRSMIEGKTQISESHRFILLFASIPRINNIYSVAFDKRSFSDSTDPFSRRPDLKVNQMIDKLTENLRQAGYTVNNKVFVEGYSNGAMFAQRYSLLHPGRVQAIAGGQCGGYITLPEDNYDNTIMDWAIGVNDFESLVGETFNQDAYKHVPHFIYIGDQDNSNSHFYHPNPDGFWSREEIDFINGIFGDSDPVRIENQCDFLKNLGYNFEFKLYTNIGHTIIDEMINDVILFFDQYRKSNNSNSGGGSGGDGCFISTMAE